MPMKLRLGGAWQDIVGAKVFSGSAWRTPTAIKVYEDGAWRDVANFTGGGGSITLSISPSPATRTGQLATITTANVTATPAGGLAPYTYAWVKQSGDDINAVSPSSAVTRFRADGMSAPETRTAIFRCTATDSLSTSDSEDVTVQITCVEGSGGPENPGQ
jgi:hypothetical protein